jgi:hypothetical protein
VRRNRALQFVDQFWIDRADGVDQRRHSGVRSRTQQATDGILCARAIDRFTRDSGAVDEGLAMTFPLDESFAAQSIDDLGGRRVDEPIRLPEQWPSPIATTWRARRTRDRRPADEMLSCTKGYGAPIADAMSAPQFRARPDVHPPTCSHVAEDSRNLNIAQELRA